MPRNVFLVLMAVLTLAACTQGGSQYLGQWSSTSNTGGTMSIVRNGDSFLVISKSYNRWTGKETEEKIPATLKDGLLEIKIGSTTGELSYIAKTDTLVISNGPASLEFKRKH